MANAEPKGKSQINKLDRMRAGTLAHDLLLSSPYAVDKIKIVRSRPIRISICKEVLDWIRSSSLCTVITLTSSTRAATVKRPPMKP